MEEITIEKLIVAGFETDDYGVLKMQIGNNCSIGFDEDMKFGIYPLSWKDTAVYPWADIKYMEQVKAIFEILSGERIITSV